MMSWWQAIPFGVAIALWWVSMILELDQDLYSDDQMAERRKPKHLAVPKPVARRTEPKHDSCGMCLVGEINGTR
jgi:hypothetical protein